MDYREPAMSPVRCPVCGGRALVGWVSYGDHWEQFAGYQFDCLACGAYATSQESELDAMQMAALIRDVEIPDALEPLMPYDEMRVRLHLMGQIRALAIMRDNPNGTFDELFAPIVDALGCSAWNAMGYLMAGGKYPVARVLAAGTVNI